MDMHRLFMQIPSGLIAGLLLPAFMWCVQSLAGVIGRRIMKWPDSKAKRLLLWTATVDADRRAKDTGIGSK